MGHQHKFGTVEQAATEGKRRQEDAAKGLSGKWQHQKAGQDIRSAIERTGAETGRLGKRGKGQEGQTVQNLDIGRPDRAEGEGRKAGWGWGIE